MARSIDDLDVAGKRVLVRGDLNVPMRDNMVSDATRINRLVPTLTELTERGAAVILMSHFGRPKGKRDPSLSLKPLIDPLRAVLGGLELVFVEDCIGPEAEAAVAVESCCRHTSPTDDDHSCHDH